jgi:hypothetical protein
VITAGTYLYLLQFVGLCAQPQFRLARLRLFKLLGQLEMLPPLSLQLRSEVFDLAPKVLDRGFTFPGPTFRIAGRGGKLMKPALGFSLCFKTRPHARFQLLLLLAAFA